MRIQRQSLFRPLRQGPNLRVDGGRLESRISETAQAWYEIERLNSKAVLLSQLVHNPFEL